MSLFRVRCEDYHTYITLRYGGAMVVPYHTWHIVLVGWVKGKAGGVLSSSVALTWHHVS